MPNIYVMDGNKNFRCTQSVKNYVNENNAESLFILLPQHYGGYDIKKCMVQLQFRENIHSEYLKCNESLYNNHLVYQLPISRGMNSKIGEKYFKIIIKGIGFEICTNECCLEISER